MAFAAKTLFLFALFVLASANTYAWRHKKTQIQFYMHDMVNGLNATAVQVASPENSTSPNPMFGSVFAMDNPLTALPERNSTLVGRAQGLYAMSSQEPSEFSLTMSLTIGFVSGPYNGSTISVTGRNSIMSAIREMPIVGGTGIFRFARGYCILRTHSFVQDIGVVGYNVTVIHLN